MVVVVIVAAAVVGVASVVDGVVGGGGDGGAGGAGAGGGLSIDTLSRFKEREGASTCVSKQFEMPSYSMRVEIANGPQLPVFLFHGMDKIDKPEAFPQKGMSVLQGLLLFDKYIRTRSSRPRSALMEEYDDMKLYESRYCCM